MSDTHSPLIDAYCKRTPTSARLYGRAKDIFPSGVTHDGRFLEPHPIYVDRAAGSRKWDVDGHEYVDYAGGHGALLLGHSHPTVVEAIARQLPRGTHLGSGHELEIRWGELVRELVPSAEMVRFTNSGTEATMLALRLARAFTGRPKILRFAGHFHGWHDHMAFGVGSHFDGTPTPGVLEGVADNVVLAPPGDIQATRAVLDSHKDIAAAIIEPTGASWGQVPISPAFIEALVEMTRARGVLLIFDEVISGFRCTPGGAQAHYGVKPDLTTLAKILAGGLPGGALVGRRDIMEYLDFTKSVAAGREKISHHGTYNGNPLSAAAGIATLEIVRSTDACRRANDYAARLRDAANQALRDEKLPWIVYGSFSGFHIFTDPTGLRPSAADIEAGKLDYRVFKTPPARSLAVKLRLGMLLHGVDIFSWPGGPTSAAHTEDDLAQTVEALRRTVRMLRDEGEIA
ncbi:MAG TPA: aspartate aminotransferase family protein [Pirellulales bacterium]|nr:aspartate aminotransferase family protein [Pirellulales bacterium]